MSVDIASLQNQQSDGVTLAKQIGYQVDVLEPPELQKFGRAFQRSLLFHGFFHEFDDLYQRHRSEILLGAMIAKKQMGAVIDGEQPAPGNVGGPIPITGKVFGIGDDWEDINGIYAGTQSTWSTGSPQNWIHSGTSLLGGTNGNAVKILDNAVHVIIGIGTLSASPKLSSVQFTIDGKTKPVLEMLRPRIGNGERTLRIKELDSAIILRKTSTVLAKVMYSEAYGAPSTYQQDFPFLIGCSYLKEDVMRVQDPATLPGTTNNVITYT